MSISQAALLPLLLVCFPLSVLPQANGQLVCSRIPYCSACVVRRVGSVTRLFCTSCAVGYGLSTDQRSCWCAPGFYWNATGSTCDPCGVGAW
jgi:hypothetical protein